MVELIFFIVLVLVFINYFFIIKIHIEVKLDMLNNNCKNNFTIKIFLLSYNIYEKIYELKVVDENFLVVLKKMEKKYENIKILLKKVKQKEIDILLRLGDGDAANTALLSGVVWGVIGNLRRNENINDILNYSKIIITPEFSKKMLKLNINCILKVQIVYIIYAIFINRKLKNK